MIKTSVGKKAVVAVTGFALFLFVVVHMLGNLQFFAGRETLNKYGEMLHALPELLWVARLGLLACVVLHVVFTVKLVRENAAARPVRYAYESTVRATWPARFMILSGLTVLLFIVYHLLHFTAHVTHPEYAQLAEVKATGETVRFDDWEEALRESDPLAAENPAVAERAAHVNLRHDVYGMVLAGFRDPLVVLIYVAAQILLAFHLSHGATSMFKTLGWFSGRHAPIVEKIGPVGAAVVCAGFLSVPLAVQLDALSGIFGFGP